MHMHTDAMQCTHSAQVAAGGAEGNERTLDGGSSNNLKVCDKQSVP